MYIIGLFSEMCDGHVKPKFKDGCKFFVIDHCQGAGKVCLVYPKKKGKIFVNFSILQL